MLGCLVSDLSFKVIWGTPLRFTIFMLAGQHTWDGRGFTITWDE